MPEEHDISAVGLRSNGGTQLVSTATNRSNDGHTFASIVGLYESDRFIKWSPYFLRPVPLIRGRLIHKEYAPTGIHSMK